jgi:fumarylacetoacetase
MMIAYGIISSKGAHEPRLAARVGSQVVDLAQLSALGRLGGLSSEVFNATTLNQLIRQGVNFRREVKQRVFAALETKTATLEKAIFELHQVKLHPPVQIGGFTDFYASKQHASNIGKIFRPQNPLLPNWQHLPIAYNGRASSVVISGHNVKRPQGQILKGEAPQLAFTSKLDFEIELGIIIGKDSSLGQAVPVQQAHEYIFGVCLVNDWSARDIQAWEYQPLGPFTSKSFLTSMSTFIVPIEELAPYKVAAVVQDPAPLDYLSLMPATTYDLPFELILKTAANPKGTVITRTNFKSIYWTMEQWITQHTISGCNLKVGDLLASGTISGDAPDSLGSLMELTLNGTKALQLDNGEQRTFLEDGDEVLIRAYAGAEILGEVSGKIIS